MAQIEVEIRSFVSAEKYGELLNYFNKNAKFVKEDFQETYYLESEEDVRIQRNSKGSKIYYKKGKIHDECREEVQIFTKRDDFEKLEELFLLLGNKVKIKWFRKRAEFDWNGVKVDLDFTKGYGYIIELEILTTKEEAEAALTLLKSKLKELNIDQTPRDVFEERFIEYKNNWEILIENDNLTTV